VVLADRAVDGPAVRAGHLVAVVHLRRLAVRLDEVAGGLLQRHWLEAQRELRGRGDDHLVQHEVAVEGAARSAARQRRIGERFEAEAGDAGEVALEVERPDVLLRARPADQDRAV
jgi:hypothetical protein